MADIKTICEYEVTENGELFAETKENKVFFIYREDRYGFSTIATYNKESKELKWNKVIKNDFDREFDLTTFDDIEKEILDYVENNLQNNNK